MNLAPSYTCPFSVQKLLPKTCTTVRICLGYEIKPLFQNSGFLSCQYLFQSHYLILKLTSDDGIIVIVGSIDQPPEEFIANS